MLPSYMNLLVDVIMYPKTTLKLEMLFKVINRLQVSACMCQLRSVELANTLYGTHMIAPLQTKTPAASALAL